MRPKLLSIHTVFMGRPTEMKCVHGKTYMGLFIMKELEDKFNSKKVQSQTRTVRDNSKYKLQ